MAQFRQVRPPIWFWVGAILLLLWGLIWLMTYYGDQMMSDEAVRHLSDYDRQLRMSIPGWVGWVYGIAVWFGVLGSLSLLFRKRIATAFFIISLLAVLVQFGWAFLATDILTVKGVAVTAPLPIVIVVIALVQIWFSQRATRRGWIG